MPERPRQPSADDVHVCPRRGDPALALLLEAVQDEHRFRELDRVDRSIRAAGIVFDHLQHAGTTEALEHLGRIVLVAHLCQRQRVTETPTHIGR